MLGEVISFSRMRGWGWIHPDGGTEDLFVHRSEIQNARYLRPNEVVEFHIGNHNGRSVAVNVWVENGGKDEADE